MKSENKVNNVKKVKNAKNKRKLSIFTLLFTSILIILVIFGCILANWIVQVVRYRTYTKQMYYYGYNELYSNKKATAFQKVTNMDMLKVVIGAVNNTTDVAKVALEKPTEEMNEDELWYEAAKDMKLTVNMERSDLKKKARKIDAVIAIMRTLEWSLGIYVEEADLQMTDKALDDFTTTEKSYIAKAVTLGIISNQDSAINKSKIIKGELNKLVIELANKYATVYYETVDIDENGNLVKNDVHIVTGDESLPSNDKDYPYIVSNIDKALYEVDFIVESKRTFKSPKEVYEEMGYLYSQIDSTITRYFDAILNVDYNTINLFQFLNRINVNSTHIKETDDVEKYIDYVKENKIILKGSAEPLLPIMYDTGARYVVRTKITFEVINSDTDTNLLFGDEGTNVKYKGKQITMYIDLPMGLTLNSNTLLVDIKSNVLSMITANENITVEKEGETYEK